MAKKQAPLMELISGRIHNGPFSLELAPGTVFPIQTTLQRKHEGPELVFDGGQVGLVTNGIRVRFPDGGCVLPLSHVYRVFDDYGRIIWEHREAPQREEPGPISWLRQFRFEQAPDGIQMYGLDNLTREQRIRNREAAAVMVKGQLYQFDQPVTAGQINLLPDGSTREEPITFQIASYVLFDEERETHIFSLEVDGQLALVGFFLAGGPICRPIEEPGTEGALPPVL